MRGEMLEVYKILCGVYDKDVCHDLFKLNGNSTRGNSKKLFKQRSRINIRKYSFCNRVVDMWNNLDDWVIESNSVISFEKNLDKFWSNLECKYVYEADEHELLDTQYSSVLCGAGFTG